jgi:sugar phosphate isomerase/epimerase
MEIGVFDDGLAELDRRSAYSWAAERGIAAIELGVGGWRRASHVDLDLLLRESRERRELQSDLSEHALTLCCINAAGNPLHPDPHVAADHAARLRGVIELAVELGVASVVTMSGCPAGPGGGALPVFAPWALNCDFESLWSWQRDHVVVPFWRELSRWLAATAPRVTVYLELHPGAFAYSPGSLQPLLEVAGPCLGVNLDPSHFWWQGIDPVVVVEQLGPRIGRAHGKDVRLHADRIARDGVLDFRYPPDPAASPWTFASVGDGHDDEEWLRLLRALQASGFDGAIAIEQEEPGVPPLVGVERSAAALRRLIDGLA